MKLLMTRHRQQQDANLPPGRFDPSSTYVLSYQLKFSDYSESQLLVAFKTKGGTPSVDFRSFLGTDDLNGDKFFAGELVRSNFQTVQEARAFERTLLQYVQLMEQWMHQVNTFDTTYERELHPTDAV